MQNEEQLRRGYESQSLQMDRLIITIATGTIVVSVTFLESIVTEANVGYTWLIKLSWIFLLGAIVSVLLSYRGSILSFRDRLAGKELAARTKRFIDATNFISCYALVIGLVLGIAFAWLSIDLRA